MQILRSLKTTDFVVYFAQFLNVEDTMRLESFTLLLWTELLPMSQTFPPVVSVLVSLSMIV